ncbi:hypothetical protein G3I34_29975 [Streptomyces sp. SID8014]|uniref:hypothetical protein n=1 Tax=Streptomyces sp. SID8014 TaxID=2706097 RepID=UPI0013B5DB9D|nr:hypothetical protein [Streptomyces sp. SID8014]NEC16423.1 hypothetical protein [Streptomyces sp. SID8014]
MDIAPDAEAQPVAVTAAPPRLLPWPSPGGTPGYLVAEDGSSRLSRLADEMEETQLETGAEILEHARAVLGDIMSPYTEVRYAGIRLAECLGDALRVAESRGMRLPYVPDETETEAEGEGEAGETPDGA